jgi:perosamine synthetase
MLQRHQSSNVVLECYPEVGFNYKMTDIQGAIGIVQMGRVDEIVAERLRLGRRYNEMLGGDPRIEIPFVPQGYLHVYQSYTVRLRTRQTQVEVMQKIADRGIATRRIIACHLEGHYRTMYPNLSLPNSESATSRTLLLPMFVGLTDQEQDQVVEAVLDSLGEAEESRPTRPQLAKVG